MISQKTAPEFAQADQLTQSEGLFAARAAQPRPAPLRARNEPAYVLAAWPWKETSLIAEILTPHYGRVSVTVRGAKRPGTKFRGLINAFVPLVVNFSGAGEVKNLTDAKWLGGLAPIAPQSLVSAFYVTELVLKLTVREDPSQELFAAYAQALTELSHEQGIGLEAVLRRFEVKLLRALGWGTFLADEKEAFDTRAWVVREGEIRAIESAGPEQGEISPAVVRAIAACDFKDAGIVRAARPVFRSIISYYVGDKGLQTRSTMARWAML